MPAYHVGVVAVATSVDPKWIDNLLARFTLPGIEHAGQGVARRISPLGLRHVLLVRWLTQDLALPLSRAVDLAMRALESEGGVIRVGPGLELRIDIPRLSADAETLLANAIESIVPRRRGRPPKSRPAGSDPRVGV